MNKLTIMEDCLVARTPSRTDVIRPKSALSMKLKELSRKRNEKAIEGKKMHQLVKTRKETESELFKKKNRVKQLENEKKRQEESIKKQKKTKSRLNTVRSKHSNFLDYINTRKKELKQEHQQRKDRIKKERENNQTKLTNARNNNLKSKQNNRNAVKAESIENSNILKRHLHIVYSYNRQRAKSISNHEKKVKCERETYFKNMTDSMNQDYVSRMGDEIFSTIHAKKQLRGLTSEEGRLVKSMISSVDPVDKYSRPSSSQDFFSTRQFDLNTYSFNLS